MVPFRTAPGAASNSWIVLPWTEIWAARRAFAATSAISAASMYRLNRRMSMMYERLTRKRIGTVARQKSDAQLGGKLFLVGIEGYPWCGGNATDLPQRMVRWREAC